MDNRFHYNESSFESLSTGIVYTDPRFHLNLVQKKDPPSDRPVIPTTMWQRLCFYRASASSSAKTDIITKQEIDINSFLWFYAATVFFDCLPHSFVHFFLAAYAPNEHIFVAKMVPISHGIKYLLVITCFLELVVVTDFLLMLAYYVVNGPLLGNPWNRCRSDTYFNPDFNATMYCDRIEKFASRFINKTNFKYTEFAMIDLDTGTVFAAAQLDHYRMVNEPRRTVNYVGVHYFIIIWGSLSIVPLVLGTRKIFWKIFMCCENAFIAFDVLIFLYVLTNAPSEKPAVRLPPAPQDFSFWYGDLEMLAQAITAPPTVHVLSSRSTEEIFPSADSALMIFSNAVYYIFKGLLANKVKAFADNIAHAEIPVTFFNEHAFLFIIPIFFTHFYWGDVFSMIYLTGFLIVEYCMVVATYVCAIETIVYEWPIIKRWMVALSFFISGLCTKHFFYQDSRLILWTYAKGIMMLTEAIALYMLYPVGRLVDDFTFHYGIPLTKLRIFSLRLVPVYVAIKIYCQFASLWITMDLDGMAMAQEITHYVWSWLILLLPIALGAVYIIYKYLVVFRATWMFILRPVPKWGPQDFSVRQLRKQFNSKYYIGSEAPRLLSRYLMTKKDSKVYKVDVRYDFYRRSSTGTGMKVAFGEMKTKAE